MLAGLLLSAAALAAAPLLMPPSYSWVAHTTSESAAQGVPGAWLPRLGFVLFGLAVLGMCALTTHRWSRLATAAHGLFAVLMVTAAAFSARSWEPDLAFEPAQDLVHSVAATAMGFAFAIGVLAVAWEDRRGPGGRVVDVAAITASVVLPLSMLAQPHLAGLLQRAMFVIAYGWYAMEAGTALPTVRRPAPDAQEPVP